MKEIPSVEFLKQLSAEGLARYESEVLNGPKLKRILNSIENAALEGYTGWRERLGAEANIRDLKVIQKELKSKDFYCEFETKECTGLFGPYKEKYFQVKWGD